MSIGSFFTKASSLMSLSNWRLAIAWNATSELVSELNRDLYEAEFKVVVAKDTGSSDLDEYTKTRVFYDMLDFILFQLDRRIDRTPANKEVDPDYKITERLDKMEQGLIGILKSIKADKEFNSTILGYVDKFQQMRDQIAERDCLLSPIVGERIHDRSSLLRAIRSD